MIASAAGKKGMPSTTEERLANVARLMALLRAHRIAPSQVRIEVTEGALMEDTEAAMSTLDALRETGVPAVLIRELAHAVDDAMKTEVWRALAPQRRGRDLHAVRTVGGLDSGGGMSIPDMCRRTRDAGWPAPSRSEISQTVGGSG